MTTIVNKRVEDEQAVLFICDYSPPRGSDPQLLEPARDLDVDFISAAYNPGKSTRVTSAFVAHWIKENTDKDVVFTVATRDMNKVATQSLLLGADLVGLENVVIVMGDSFSEKERAVVKAVHDYRPTELVAAVNDMNEGRDFKGLKLRTPTSLCVGATVDLGHSWKRELPLTRKKVKAGAKFFLLQALFKPQQLTDFLGRYADVYDEEISAPIFCGVQVMSPDSIVFGDIPDWVKGDLDKDRSGVDVALQVLGGFLDRGFRSIYLVPPILKGGRRDYEAAVRFLEAHRG